MLIAEVIDRKPPKIKHEAPMDLEQPAPTVVDLDFIKDVLFAFQGIDGHSVLYSQMDECYIVQPQLQVSDSIRRVVSELCEVGWLYRQVSEYVSLHTEDPGLVQQSFCSALRLELSEYYRLLALLEQRETEFAGTAHLLKLKIWCQEPLSRMKWLCILVEAAQGLKGGALASCVYSFSVHGNPEVSELVGRVLQEVSKPIFEMIKSWMTKGEFYDPFHEFFIMANSAAEDLWRDGYCLHDDMVPAYLTAPIVAKILLTGKSVSFLNRCCGVEELLDFGELREVAGLHKWVEEAAVVANNQLVRVMIDKYRFLDHCEALRKYLLMGQGDFHHSLIESLWDELALNASAIYGTNLVALLEGAIRASNAQYDDSEFLSRLDVRLLEASPGEIGWDVFTLEYHMEAPLSTVFTAAVLEKYLRLFKFFWKLKRVEYFLTTKSYRPTSHLIELMNHPQIRTYLQRCQLLRHEIAHFVINLMSYLMVEVIESGWKEFIDSVAKLADMDQLITAHSLFLDRLVSRAFLSSNFEFIYKKLLQLLDLALRFAYSQEALYLSADEELHRLKRFMAEGLEDNSYDEEYASRLSQEAIRDMDQVAEQFLTDLESFQQLLEKHDQGHLKFLSFRLDFNEFYAKKSLRC
jgi:gamma-tubulin complex component 3